MKLSGAIREGKTKITESRLDFLTPRCGCAIGLAYVGAGHQAEYMLWHEIYKALRNEFKVSDELLDEINDRHAEKGESALEIADWLETQGQ